MCPSLAYLRYYGPVIEYIKDLNDLELFFAVRRNSKKYTAFAIKENYNRFLEINDKHFNSIEIIPDIDKKSTKTKCDILFTLCGAESYRFDYERHYAIQHGYDHLVHGKFPDSRTIHLVANEVYGLLVKQKFNVKYKVAPLPIAFTNLSTQIEFARKIIPASEKVVTIFFPRKGSKRLVRSIVKYLKKKDYFVVIKQRRKSQAVPKKIESDLIVYDDIWYPSEAVFYPAISDIAIGFGSAIFTDLCDAGIPVIDNAILKYARTGKEFVRIGEDHEYIRPEYENYWYFYKDFGKNTKSAIDYMYSNNIKNRKFVPVEVIKQFYIDLLNI